MKWQSEGKQRAAYALNASGKSIVESFSIRRRLTEGIIFTRAAFSFTVQSGSGFCRYSIMFFQPFYPSPNRLRLYFSAWTVLTGSARALAFGIVLFAALSFLWIFAYGMLNNLAASVYAWSKDSMPVVANLIASADKQIRHANTKWIQKDAGLGVLRYEFYIKEKKEWAAFLKQQYPNAEFSNDGHGFLKAKVNTGKESSAWITVSDYQPVFSNTAVAYQSVKGIYLSGSSATPQKISFFIQYLKKGHGNGIVYDVKDVTGYLNYPTIHGDVKNVQKGIRAPIPSLKKLHARLGKEKIYSIARVTLFQDEVLAKSKPNLAIHLQNGKPLLVKGRPIWVDPYKKEVRDYNLKIIWEVIHSGVNEIQLDYVRYPAEGNWKQARYAGLTDHYEKPRVLAGFLQQVHSLTSAYGVKLSIDIFGVVAWQEKLDIKSTGQDMRILSQAADVLSPMLYPSHFENGFGGVASPGDHPYEFILTGIQKLQDISGETVIRPWIQAFAWRVSNYNAQYIEKQIQATFDSGETGFLLWNAGNEYLSFRMPEEKRKRAALKSNFSGSL